MCGVQSKIMLQDWPGLARIVVPSVCRVCAHFISPPELENHVII